MSLILEALRKSEAERRLAQAPDLFAPAQVAVAPARRVPLAWLAGGGTLALVVAGLLLVQALGPAPQRSEPANVAAADAPAEAAPPATRVATPARPVAPADTPPRLLPEAPPAAAAEPPASVPMPPAGDAVADVAVGDTGEPAPAPVPAPPPTAPATPVAATADLPPADATAPPMRLSELSGDARRQLPPLKLTMHMWNEAAERRFVILDGRRLAEGDRIGPVRVAEIRRDGVLLDWNGQRLELPLR